LPCTHRRALIGQRQKTARADPIRLVQVFGTCSTTLPSTRTSVVVRLSRAAEVGRPAPSVAPAVTAASRPLRVLVVDDNVDAARMLGVLLRLPGTK
jgi:hypothetical protein